MCVRRLEAIPANQHSLATPACSSQLPLNRSAGVEKGTQELLLTWCVLLPGSQHYQMALCFVLFAPLRLSGVTGIYIFFSFARGQLYF